MTTLTALAAPKSLSLRAPMAVSMALHLLAAAALAIVRSPPPVAAPRMYRVNLVAAPPAERQIGVVEPAPAPATRAPLTPPVAPSRAVERPAVEKAIPAPKTPPLKAPPKATPSAATSTVTVPHPATPNLATPTATAPTPPPTAGGGPLGGGGADVANVKTEGVGFPYPDYLKNVVRQIALQFKPSARGALVAEVSFLIRRDGTIAALRVTKGSPVYSFNQDALAAVELAARLFGPLPSGFSDDVLPVIFSFDPRLIR